ncbi:N-acetyltransferase family protein [Verrucomicrobiota bacterium sgz303538]
MSEPRPFSTRKATLADSELLLAMMKDFYRDEHIAFEYPKARRAAEELIQSPELGAILLLSVGDEIVGYLVAIYSFILEFGGRQAFLDELYIREEWRGQGYSKQALAALEKMSRDSGIRVLRLEVSRSNARALTLYERAGFELHDRFTMTKLL